MQWIIPSEPWANEMRLIMESCEVSMNEAFKLLREHGDANKAFDHLTAAQS